MKKIFIMLLSVMILGACAPTKQIELAKPATLSFFYIEDCSQCQAFKKNVIPLLEKTFGNQLTIHQYDLDDEATEKVYDQVIDSLSNFDEEFYGNGPFIVLDGYFAVLGYDAGDEEYLLQDIENVVAGQQAGYELEGRRFIFKDKQ